MYKELIQLNQKDPNTPIKNIGRGPEQTLFPRKHADGQQIYEKTLNLTSYKQNVNQNHLTPVRMATINKTRNKCWRR